MTVKNLGSFEKGTILEIRSIKEIEGEQGKYGVAVYATTLLDGKRQAGKVRLTETAMNNPSMVAPCFALYNGMKSSKNGKLFHDVSAVKFGSSDMEQMRKLGDNFRKMNKLTLLAHMSTQTLDSFKPNTVFMFKDVKKRKVRKDHEDAVTVAFETEVDGEKVEGTLIVPARIEAELRATGAGLLLYRGHKVSQASGRSYADVEIINDDLLQAL